MKQLKQTILLLLLTGAVLQHAKAQDPHYTQYYIYPAWLNPALTGVFDGDVRVSGIYRSQWGSIAPAFNTPGVAADFNATSSTAFGISALRQSAGDGGFSHTTAYGSMSFSGVRFGKNGYHRLNLGLQAGLIQKKFDFSKATFGNQYNAITGYNPGTGGETFVRGAQTNFDAGAGALYFDATPGKKMNLFAGFSVAHLTRPNDRFIDGSEEAKLAMRYNFHAGVRIMLSDRASITPNALYMKQGEATEKMLGAYVQCQAAPGTDVMIGANCRFGDALSPFVGVNYNNWVLGASYDINTSDLGKIAKGANSFEISLSTVIRRKVKTEEVEFVCPRL
ncbi:PorP/SprF family type IX secretion system membrane protein [Filimonas effusa]|uniref:Type IX secretion system membrane protein PorP/SprF n=1 Tax=Filimonas effusa TaxID=2508721 RepID=A0A4Q1D575_9BACT|nr:PorP/SprF family type IX secretion system membrane protein [Filimonas effusa]RXK82817.1 type IX secretion system membrane protein PorP/SprF [Filimonas effusa]